VTRSHKKKEYKGWNGFIYFFRLGSREGRKGKKAKRNEIKRNEIKRNEKKKRRKKKKRRRGE
jgi:hypothetical protein